MIQKGLIRSPVCSCWLAATGAARTVAPAAAARARGRRRSRRQRQPAARAPAAPPRARAARAPAASPAAGTGGGGAWIRRQRHAAARAPAAARAAQGPPAPPTAAARPQGAGRHGRQRPGQPRHLLQHRRPAGAGGRLHQGRADEHEVPVQHPLHGRVQRQPALHVDDLVRRLRQRRRSGLHLRPARRRLQRLVQPQRPDVVVGVLRPRPLGEAPGGHRLPIVGLRRLGRLRQRRLGRRGGRRLLVQEPRRRRARRRPVDPLRHRRARQRRGDHRRRRQRRRQARRAVRGEQHPPAVVDARGRRHQDAGSAARTFPYNQQQGGFIGDLDGDGRNDILVGDRWWYRSSGPGTMAMWTPMAIPAAPAFAAGGSANGTAPITYMGDIDGDGDLDIVVQQHWGSKVAWFANADGKGTMWTAHLIVGTGRRLPGQDPQHPARPAGLRLRQRRRSGRVLGREPGQPVDLREHRRQGHLRRAPDRQRPGPRGQGRRRRLRRRSGHRRQALGRSRRRRRGPQRDHPGPRLLQERAGRARRHPRCSPAPRARSGTCPTRACARGDGHDELDSRAAGQRTGPGLRPGAGGDRRQPAARTGAAAAPAAPADRGTRRQHRRTRRQQRQRRHRRQQRGRQRRQRRLGRRRGAGGSAGSGGTAGTGGSAGSGGASGAGGSAGSGGATGGAPAAPAAAAPPTGPRRCPAAPPWSSS